ncbi:MAG: hypothetical protein LBP24_03960, partial [Coriobacteriales bacterium]|nr:hypothetical protein [Coriobacteriales bacterium]
MTKDIVEKVVEQGAGEAAGEAAGTPSAVPNTSATAAVAATTIGAPGTDDNANSTVPAIECNGLHLRYPHGRSDALAGVSLRIPQGALCGLFGRNGAGKTT